MDFTIKEGTTRRIKLEGRDANEDPYDYTDSTVEFLAKAASGDPDDAVRFTLAIDAGGNAVSDPPYRMFLGRPNDADLDGPLIDTTATSGWITVRFAPGDTKPLVTTQNKTFLYECQVRRDDPNPDLVDAYTLDEGAVTVVDSLFHD
jgi:hypothetical protein